MFEVWYVSITLAIISVIFSSLIVLEMSRLRSQFSTKLTATLLAVTSFLSINSILDLFSFIMWSSNRDPIYVYPSLLIGIFTTLSIIFLYYFIRQ